MNAVKKVFAHFGFNTQKENAKPTLNYSEMMKEGIEQFKLEAKTLDDARLVNKLEKVYLSLESQKVPGQYSTINIVMLNTHIRLDELMKEKGERYQFTFNILEGMCDFYIAKNLRIKK